MSPEFSSEQTDGIPLYLIPKVIAEEIKKKRERVFQITVERQLYHCYKVIVETFDEHAARLNTAEMQPAQSGDSHL